jgi:signal transduction histidine kinase
MRRPTVKGIRLRLALALLLVVAGALAVVYLILVPSLETELINARLDQLEDNAPSAVRGLQNDISRPQEFAEAASSIFNARVVVYTVLKREPPPRLFIFGDSRTTSSLDVERDPIAIQAARTRRLQRGVVERNGQGFTEVAISVPGEPTVILLSDSLESPLSSVRLVQRRLLIAGLIGLLFAVVVGYGAATMHARRIRRLERAAERIASGQFDEPVVDTGNDELGQLADAFERMRVRLEKLDRARSEFIANASHELRTPLFSLGGFLELMADEDVDENTRREFLETMGEQVERLAKLATDLLDLSRLDAGQIRVEHEAVDLGEIVQAVAAEFRGVAERSRHPVEVVVEGQPVARADELRVLQVARALADNAFLHTPEGTRITLRAHADREHAYLEVEDEGPGVPAEHAPHVFDRFYRADGGIASGSGLGLAIARELVTVMNGDVVLESKPGRTVVRVVLGAAPTSVPAPEATERVFP